MLGILAAIVIPVYQDQSEKAKESAAKDNLRILRDAIERYAIEHDDVPPGYRNNDPDSMAHENYFEYQLCNDGNYLSEIPENPFNNNNSVQIVTGNFPEADQQQGWMYKPSTRQIRIDKKGTDSEGKPFSEY
jgi:type II secretory pathway pseudopilin PulG